jgi:hypothetical protein
MKTNTLVITEVRTKKNCVFEVDLDGKPKTQKNPNIQNPKSQKTPKKSKKSKPKKYPRVGATQMFEPKKNWVFGSDFDGKPKTLKKIHKFKTNSKIRVFWIFKFKIQLN